MTDLSPETVGKLSDREILLECREFVRKQSEGEWDEKTIAADAARMAEMVKGLIGRALAGGDRS